MRKTRKYPSKEVILSILKLGTLLTVAMLAPNAILLFKKKEEFIPWEDYHQPLLRRNIRNLERKGYVIYSEENGNTIIKITDKGKTEILKFNLDNLSIDKSKKWDKLWRLIIFDISEEKKAAREAIRKKLIELECYQFQESVFITPYPCEKEMKFLREIYDIADELKIIIAISVDNEEELKKIFGLS